MPEPSEHTFERMKRDGGDIGALVEITLKPEVHFNLQTTLVPTYHHAGEGLPAEQALERRFCGYILGFSSPSNPKALVLTTGAPGPSGVLPDGHGGIHLDEDAIDSYKVYAPSSK